MKLDDIIEIENIVPKKLQDELEEFHTSSFFPWHYVKDTVSNVDYKFKKTENTFETSFFNHLHYKNGQVNSNKFADVKNILYFFEEKTKINVRNPIRIQSNLTRNITGYKEGNHSAIHGDWEEKVLPHSPTMFCSLLYYVNDSDGDTKFFDNDYNEIKSVSPKKGKAVLFNSQTLHAGSNPIKNDVRIVINFILEVENYF